MSALAISRQSTVSLGHRVFVTISQPAFTAKRGRGTGANRCWQFVGKALRDANFPHPVCADLFHRQAHRDTVSDVPQRTGKRQSESAMIHRLRCGQGHPSRCRTVQHQRTGTDRAGRVGWAATARQGSVPRQSMQRCQRNGVDGGVTRRYGLRFR
jgi:hypothetical protein